MERDLLPAELIHSVRLPGYAMPAPVVAHLERIPSDIFQAMRGGWDKPWFAPHQLRIAVLEDVIVTIEGLVFTRDLTLIAPTRTQHSEEEVAEGREMARVALTGGDLPRQPGLTLLARKRGAGNYGHWLVEMLPKVWLARRHADPAMAVMIQDDVGALDQVMRDSLEAAGVAPERVVAAGRGPVLVERLVVVDGLTYHAGYMSPLVMEALDDITAAIAPEGAERLLVLRGPGATRRFADEASVRAAADQGGFGTCDPGAMSWRAQIAAFKAARRVVGVMGAGLSNLAVSPPGAQVTVLAPAGMPDLFFWFIAGLRGLAMAEIRCNHRPAAAGPAPWDGEVMIDDDDLRCFDPAWPGLVTRAPPDWRAVQTVIAQSFDPARHVARFPELAASGEDPLTHYIAGAWRQVHGMTSLPPGVPCPLLTAILGDRIIRRWPAGR